MTSHSDTRTKDERAERIVNDQTSKAESEVAVLKKAMIEAIRLAADIARGDWDHEGYQEQYALQIVNILSEPFQP